MALAQSQKCMPQHLCTHQDAATNNNAPALLRGALLLWQVA